MQVRAISLHDVTDPQELNDWFSANPSITMHEVVNFEGIFYIFYESL